MSTQEATTETTTTTTKKKTPKRTAAQKRARTKRVRERRQAKAKAKTLQAEQAKTPDPGLFTDDQKGQPAPVAAMQSLVPPGMEVPPSVAPIEPDPLAKGIHLAPDFAQPGKGIEARRWYWCGTFPSVERGEITVAGISFVRIHQTVMPRDATGRSPRFPHIGQCMHLSKVQVEAICERLPYMVYRFHDVWRHYDTTGHGIEALSQDSRRDEKNPEMPHRRGTPIRIMTDAEREMRKKNGVPMNAYHPEALDEALAHHLFIVPCDNQERPMCGQIYPPSVYETGLAWDQED